MNSNSPVEQAKQAIKSNHCVAFLGAGVSKPAAPDWPELVVALAEHCGVKMEDRDMWPEVVDKCIARSRMVCNEYLDECFPACHQITRTALIYLADLPFKCWVTTNFDTWLTSQALKPKNDKSQFWVYPYLSLVDGIDQQVYYLHGLFDTNNTRRDICSLVFGRRSFEEAYSQSLLPGVILQMLVFQSVLFVGFDPTQREFASLYRNAWSIRRSIEKSEGLPIAHQHFALWADPSDLTNHEHEEEIQKIRAIQEMGIQVIPYPSQRNHGYRGLDILLQTWHQEIASAQSSRIMRASPM